MAKSSRLPPPEYRKEPGLLLTSAAQRKAVFARDGGKCCKCGVKDVPWCADHAFPLHAVPDWAEYPRALDFWRIGNIQTLCRDICHKAKTKIEVVANAKVKRIRLKVDGVKKATRTFTPCPKKWPQKKKTPRVSRHKPVISYI